MQLYQIGKLIGTGSSGDVFLCRHIKEKNFNYALKKIKTFEVDEKQRENIENELKLLQKLRHINIVSYKDSFTDKEGNLCIIMAYCEMGDMHTKIKQMKEKSKYFTQSQILDWVTQISLAIYYLHNQKILHRDLKTQNLFLKKQDRIRLGDFGIAKVLDTTQDLARTCIGTPYYMAPEMFKEKPYSYKSDIWSLGIILYEICNLRLPFEAQHYGALAMKILKGTYPSIMPTYSKQLRDLISSMLSLKPQQRPTIVEILNKPFIKTRVERYMTDYLTRSVQAADMDDIYIDSLRQQATSLNIQIGNEEDTIKKYPSSKDLQKRQLSISKSYMTKRSEEEEDNAQFYHKRKSTVQKDSSTNGTLRKNQQSSSSTTKGLNMQYNISEEKDAFVDHKKTIWMDREDKKNGKLSQFSKESMRRFKIYEEYTMDQENELEQNIDMEPIDEQVITEQSDEDLQSTTHNIEDQQEVPQTYNKSYYKLLDKIKVLKHRCETALGGNKYLRAYNAVNNGANKATMLQILGQQMIGYWHLIDQIMFNESILKTLPKN